MKEIEELKAFWDDFAKEYTEIQNESEIPLIEDLIHYMAQEQAFPTSTFLDLAGGSGKYIDVFLPYVQQYTLVDFSKEMLRIAKEEYPNPNILFLEKEQSAFFKETADQAYDVIFSAMNPALQTQADLAELLRIAKKQVYLLRLTSDKDSLFSPLEQQNKDWSLMTSYKQWLKMPYQVKEFIYRLEEVIGKDLFFDYFEGEVSEEGLQEIAKRTFNDEDFFKNPRQITFELIAIKK